MLLTLEALKQPPFYHEMIIVEGGTFMMGNDDEEASWYETMVHPVTVGSFKMAKYPVTQAFWLAVMGKNPSHFKGDALPVEQVSWLDTQAFMDKLRKMTGEHYRLPTEAEWEFAARGGNLSKGFKYAGGDDLGALAWYEENSHGATQPVGLKAPNELGLHDMVGNVWEWCEDQWLNSYERAPMDGAPWLGFGADAYRVVRGGSMQNEAKYCRPTFRLNDSPDSRHHNGGFRLASSA